MLSSLLIYTVRRRCGLCGTGRLAAWPSRDTRDSQNVESMPRNQQDGQPFPAMEACWILSPQRMICGCCSVEPALPLETWFRRNLAHWASNDWPSHTNGYSLRLFFVVLLNCVCNANLFFPQSLSMNVQVIPKWHSLCKTAVFLQLGPHI